MLEEAIRFLFPHPRFAEEPQIAAFGGFLVAGVSILAQWQCFTDNAMEGSARPSETAAGGGAVGGGGGGGDSPSAKLSSSLLRLISLALTVAKAAARYPDSSGQWSGASFSVWKTCAVHLFRLPQRMHAARGVTALLLHPACSSIQRTIAAVALADTPDDEAVDAVSTLSENAAFSLLVLLHSCSNDSLSPRLAVDVLMAAPALSLVEQEAGRLSQAPSSDSVAEGISWTDAASFDGLAAATASYISCLMMGLVCSVFSAPLLNEQQREAMLHPLELLLWLGMPMDPSSCREARYCLNNNQMPISAAFQRRATSATPELAEESLAALSHILSGPIWDRVLGYNSASAAATADDWLLHIASGLCCAASILELHPAVRQYNHKGSGTPGGSTLEDGYGDATSSAHVTVQHSHVASSTSSGHDVAQCTAALPAAALAPQSMPSWQEARRNIAEALCLLSTTYSHAAVVRELSMALGQIRAVLSGIVSQAAAVGGDSSAGAAAAVPVSGQNSLSRGGLGMRDWECVQSELLLGLPEELWGVRPCCNTACVRLEGPCEMEVKTRACGGGCGARYCCVACQEQAWRGGHQRNCAEMREMTEKRGREAATGS